MNARNFIWSISGNQSFKSRSCWFITYWVISNVLKLQNHPSLCFILICLSPVVHISDEGLCCIFPLLCSCGGQWQRGFGGCLTSSQGQSTTGTKPLPIIAIDLVGVNCGKQRAEACTVQKEAGQELYCYRHLKFRNIPTAYYNKLKHSQSFSWQRKEDRRGRKHHSYICSYYLDTHLGCREPALWFSNFCIESRNFEDIFPFTGTQRLWVRKVFVLLRISLLAEQKLPWGQENGSL